MNTALQQDWQQANQDYLQACLDLVRQKLQRKNDTITADAPPLPIMQHEESAALEDLCAVLHLSAFERFILLLCAGIELDSDLALLCSQQPGAASSSPTFALALSLFPEAHWSALSPDGALRRWRLIEVETARSIMLSPLRIDERILHYLLGTSYLDTRLSPLMQELPAANLLVPSHQRIAREVATLWALAAERDEMPVVQLCGPESLSHRHIAAMAGTLLHHTFFRMSIALLPHSLAELENVLHLWERETLLGQSALFLDCQTLDHLDALQESLLTHVVESCKSLLIISTRERRTLPAQTLLTFDVEKPTRDEQRSIWQARLGAQAQSLDSSIDQLVAHFHLNTDTILSICSAAEARLFAEKPPGEAQTPTAEAFGKAIWEVCRTQAHPHLQDLAQRIEPSSTWANLILPDAQLALLHTIVLQIRQRPIVYETWGIANPGARGLGISALFTGTSGVGKTMAAEVLARELQLDLYKIDLSAMVSKYIGETEKNLRRVFDAAEGSGVILLFDEADALFGKRSEVKDSHDRHANIEVSYLLQRMEAYQGIAILTTNMKDMLDHAFLRRIRFIVQFPFPDARQRAEIWRQVFPPKVPTGHLDLQKLAQLNIAGGTIRNIALHATFLAADKAEPPGMQHILQAAAHEYAKLEKPLTQAERRGWDEADEH